jgi:hypothetical protein
MEPDALPAAYDAAGTLNPASWNEINDEENGK